MSEQVAQQKKESLKWSLIVLLLVSGIVLNTVFAKIALPIRFIAWILLIAFLAMLAYYTERGKAAWAFIQAAQVELKKVIWPTRQETLQTTLVTVLMVFIMSMLLWGIDSVLLWAVSLLTGQRG